MAIRHIGGGVHRAENLMRAKLEAQGVYYMHAPMPGRDLYSRQVFRAAARRMAKRPERQNADAQRRRTCTKVIAKRSGLKDRFPQKPGRFARGLKHAWQRKGSER